MDDVSGMNGKAGEVYMLDGVQYLAQPAAGDSYCEGCAGDASTALCMTLPGCGCPVSEDPSNVIFIQVG